MRSRDAEGDWASVSLQATMARWSSSHSSQELELCSRGAGKRSAACPKAAWLGLRCWVSVGPHLVLGGQSTRPMMSQSPSPPRQKQCRRRLQPRLLGY